MSRALELTRKEAESLGIIGEKPKRQTRRRRDIKPSLREEEIVAFRYRQPYGDAVIGPWILCLTIPSAPRPKKNNTRVTWIHGKPVQVHRPSYYRFVNDVCRVILPRRKGLKLPLPKARYHINAQFFCDNDLSDLKNLEQGLADALEKAEVVTNDHQLEAWDGSRRWTDRARPRVEITITQLSA